MQLIIYKLRSSIFILIKPELNITSGFLLKIYIYIYIYIILDVGGDIGTKYALYLR